MDCHTPAAAHWPSREEGEWPSVIIHSPLSWCFSFASSCSLMSQVHSRAKSVRFLALHRLWQLADRLRLRQHPRPRPLPSASGLCRLVVGAGRGLRLSSALQFPGGGAWRTDVSSRMDPPAAPGSEGTRWDPGGFLLRLTDVLQPWM